jgi:L-threonylcarbamoyladenylate synthase
MSEVLRLDGDAEEDARAKVAAILDEGRLAVVATDTMYAVLSNPFHPHATHRVYSAREAARTSPLPVFVHSHMQLPALAEVSEQATRLAQAFWPGPLTLLLPSSGGMAWDLGDAQGTVAVRMPDDAFLLDVLSLTGPLAATAASRAGEAPPATVDDAIAALGDAVALYIDGGPREPAASTVVDCSRGGAEVRRRGPISADAVFTAATSASPTEPAVPPPSAPVEEHEPPAEEPPAGV